MSRSIHFVGTADVPQ